MRGLLIFALFAFFSVQSWPQQSNEEITKRNIHWTAHILKDKSALTHIMDLNLVQTKVPILLVSSQKKIRPMIEIILNYHKPMAKLSASGDTKIRKGKNDYEIVLETYLTGKVTIITLKSTLPDFHEETEMLYIYAPEAQEFIVESAWDKLLVSVGLANISYFQSYYGDYKSYNGLLYMKYATDFNSNRLWGIFFELQTTVLTFWASPVASGPQLIEAKLGLVRSLQIEMNNNSKLQLVGGINYLSMIANDSPFGFSDLVSPDLGVTFTKYVNPKDTWISEFHLIPINSAKLSDGGLNLKLRWNRLLKNSHRLEIGSSISNYSYSADDTRDIKVRLIGITIGYSL